MQRLQRLGALIKEARPQIALTFVAARRKVGFAAGLLLAMASSAHATEITFTVTGVVTSAGGGSNFPFPDMAVGDPFSVAVSFNDAFSTCGGGTPSVNCYFPDKIAITNRGVTFTDTSFGFGSSIQVFNDTQIPNGPALGDAIVADGNGQPGPFNLGHAHLQLMGNTNPLGSPTIPSDPGSLSGWDPSLSSFFLVLQDMENSGGSFSGTIDIAPEPTTLWLLGSGIAGLVIFARSKRD